MTQRIATLTVALVIGITGIASAQTITVVNQAHVSTGELRKAEKAIVLQSLQVRRYWQTPAIRFGNGGWTVTLIGSVEANCGIGYVGCHMLDGQNNPTAYVSRRNWTDTLSHEIIEMMVDGQADRYINGQLVEAADPVEGTGGYKINGVSVADFVLPAYYTTDQKGQLDYTNTFAASCLYSLKAAGC